MTTFIPGTFVRIASGRLAGMTGTVVACEPDGMIRLRLSATCQPVRVRPARLRIEAGRQTTWRRDKLSEEQAA